ncbi:GNAT family N-acetyltransferase [Pontibacter sp. KCTC 32443]|uniref:GNAT family N-acetyltransferase n=1 Tax=Pontibacter TaxID=323449 RepID=UPI00164D7816|nr:MULTISPECIES: GNAT family protein [Pontibacter]MBC5772645.1 GNAT family N-acetyltransferase [Pontibacter sp. KCTC 32443]
MHSNLSVRELQEQDITLIADYWLKSDSEHLIGMGVDMAKLPTRQQLTQMLQAQLNAPLHEKQSYCVIWEVDSQAVGHSNINKIMFGEEAYMHLHMWRSDIRKQGLGSALVKMSLPYFFENLQLKTLYCEPYALNPAPNKTLQKVGFELEKEYITIPGSLNFEQPVKRWRLSYSKYKSQQEQTE